MAFKGSRGVRVGQDVLSSSMSDSGQDASESGSLCQSGWGPLGIRSQAARALQNEDHEHSEP